MKTVISTRQILLPILLLLIGTGYGYASYQERVYLQTDKQFYIAGELLWLKLYTTNTEGELSSFSKVGYIELLNDSIPEIQVRLDLTDGTGWNFLSPYPRATIGWSLTPDTCRTKEKIYFLKKRFLS